MDYGTIPIIGLRGSAVSSRYRIIPQKRRHRFFSCFPFRNLQDYLLKVVFISIQFYVIQCQEYDSGYGACSLVPIHKRMIL